MLTSWEIVLFCAALNPGLQVDGSWWQLGRATSLVATALLLIVLQGCYLMPESFRWLQKKCHVYCCSHTHPNLMSSVELCSCSLDPSLLVYGSILLQPVSSPSPHFSSWPLCESLTSIDSNHLVYMEPVFPAATTILRRGPVTWRLAWQGLTE